jgi:VanZ family protein
VAGCNRGVGPVQHSYGSVVGGPLRKLNGIHRVTAARWHVVAIGCALFVACSTALPAGVDLWLFVEKLVTPRFVGMLAVVSAFVGGLTLAALAWRRRHLWISRLSVPLVGYMVMCGVGLAMLVLISQPPRYLARFGLSELRGIADEFDVRHIISYFGFAVVAAIAWRKRASLPVLGVLLMAYGFGLELVQELVPTRNFRIEDLASNGLGVLLGLCWVYLYDSLFGAKGTSLSWPARRRRRRVLTKRSGIRVAMQPRGS